MKLVVTHVLSEAGSEFYEQKLYHVPSETARQIASDFEAFGEGRLDGDAQEAPTTKTYDYPLDVSTSMEDAEEQDTSAVPSAESREARGPEEEPEAQPRGILSIDFRTVAAIQAYDRLS